MSIRANDLIDVFERMAREHWSYEWGAAREGCVDCSGAFVYAYKVLGGLSIAHGSNTIARKHCGALVPASEAKPGYAMFRWREDGEPERYRADGKGDYYHIGLMGRDGRVLNARGTAAGFVESTLAGWAYAAPLLAVDYEGEVNTMTERQALYSAVVATERDPLALRNAPEGDRIGKLPRGATVSVLAENGGWAYVSYGGVSGYCSAAYLTRCEPEAGQETKESRTHAALLLTDSAGNTWTPVGDFSVRRVAVEGESLGADTID